MKIVSSGRYAAVTSTLALVIALGGTSYAAAKITGRDIKDNTVYHRRREEPQPEAEGLLLLGHLRAEGRPGERGDRGGRTRSDRPTRTPSLPAISSVASA